MPRAVRVTAVAALGAVITGCTPALEQGDGFQACRQPDRYVLSRSAPPYSGPGPHPVLVEDLDSGRTSFPPVRTPRTEWAAPDAARAQLLVCVTAVPAATTGEPLACPYDRIRPITFFVVDGSYRVTVRQARTNAVVGELTVPADPRQRPNCPYGVDTDTPSSDPFLIVRPIDAAAFEQALRPIIA